MSNTAWNPPRLNIRAYSARWSIWRRRLAAVLFCVPFLAPNPAQAGWTFSGLDNIIADGIPDTIRVTWNTTIGRPLVAIGTPDTFYGFGPFGSDYYGNLYGLSITITPLVGPSTITTPFEGSLDVVEIVLNPLEVSKDWVIYATVPIKEQGATLFSDNGYYAVVNARSPTSAVPEPGTLGLTLVPCLLLAAGVARRRNPAKPLARI